MTSRARSRLLRRELHRSRSVPAVVVALLVTLLAAWLGVESALRLAGRDPLLVSPGAALRLVREQLADPGPAIVAVGVGALVLGVLALMLAFAPGRRQRHEMKHPDLVVVVDDAVVADVLGSTARRTASLPSGRDRTWVSRKQARVDLTPTSGEQVPIDEVRKAVAAQAEEIGTVPPVQVRVEISGTGRLS